MLPLTVTTMTMMFSRCVNLRMRRVDERGQDDAMNAEMNTLKFEQKSSSDAVQAKERELQKIQVGGGWWGAAGYCCE